MEDKSSYSRYFRDLVLMQYVSVNDVQVGLIALLPRVVDLVGDRDITVVAAGSIADARGYVAALSLGAKGICMGTR